ncbi:MAG: EAL domain-containing protein [Pseudomonadota bacterium]
MIQALNVLVIEDEANDAELAMRALRRADVDCRHRRVETEAHFRRALADGLPDIILSDFSMPRFDGMRALSLARDLCPDIPFVFVSGTIGEVNVIEALKKGATDYVLKQDLARLAPAVKRALSDAEALVERRRTQAALLHSELRFRLAASTGDVWDWTVATGAAHISPQWKQRLGYEECEIHNTAEAWLALLDPDDRLAVLQAFSAHIRLRRPYDIEYRVRARDGSYRWLHAKGQAIWDAHGVATYMAGTMADVTERKRAELKVTRLNRVYAVLSGINALIVRVQSREELFRGACQVAVDVGKFRLAWIGHVEPATQRLRPTAWSGVGDDYIEHIPLGLNEMDAEHYGLVGQAVTQRTAMIVQDVATDPRVVVRQKALERNLRSFAVLPLVVANEAVGAMTLYTGETGFFDDTELTLLRELAGDIAFAMDHLGKSDQLNHLAYYDALTGLPNRSLVHDRLSQILQVVRAGGDALQQVALALINIDRFKTINDTLGRHTGDALLKLVAERLGTALGSTDRLARLGGDQFAAILGFRGEPAEVAHIFEDQIFPALKRPYQVGEKDLYLTFRVGIALFPGDGGDAEALFTNAEVASRTAGTAEGRYQFYAPPMNARVSGKLNIENKLHRALANEEFVLHYQPKVNLQDGSVVGVEALIRWNDPDTGLTSPAEFVPILEETGMIVEAGHWVLRQAIADIEMWRACGLDAPRVAVNVSAVQMRRKDFLSLLKKALAGSGGGNAGVDLELTESLLMEDIDANVSRFMAIREMGVRLAVDDFGTGYSSLSYLKRFPIDYLKIDQSFVRDITTDPDAAAICVAVIDLAHNLKLKVIAEGVETEGQMHYLRRRRCDEMQGYFFSRPLPADGLAQLLRDRKTLLLPTAADGERKTLLIVDDEAGILSAMRRLLRHDGYEIFAVGSAREGFEVLARHDVQVILSDQRMPEMNGTEFLSRARDLYPDTIRIVLSGYTDLESISGAINRGAIYKFLTKPWDDELLRENIREAFRHHDVAKRKR